MNSSAGLFLVDEATQSQIDILKKEVVTNDSVVRIYPFNPNFITDYKGYTLGMSAEEIDRLHAFRKQNKFANSAEEFQKVTMISDSLLSVISPYFKFPEWTKTENKKPFKAKLYPNRNNENLATNVVRSNVLDLNSATAEDLQSISGIGEKLSARIVKYRELLNGFLIDEQLYEVYYLDREVAEKVLKKYKVLSKPKIEKININKASIAEISKLTYIKYSVAKEIVAYREINGSITSFDELKDIVDFPADKIDRIKLYLAL
ncbi:ComEA family DNA-binding protein [Kriegella aquimaris]|nr:helix-hairpin-helix domain-containing protein [Kriegella aquimaris]